MSELDRPDLSGPDAGRLLSALFDCHAPGLHAYLARRLDTATADDLVAETFLAAWTARNRYRPDKAPARAWLYGIATNLLRRHARGEVRGLRAYAREGGKAVDVALPETLAVSRADASTHVRAMAGGIAELRQEERDVLLLIAWAGLQPAEAAEALGITSITCRTRLHRARKALRKYADLLEEHHD
ncbi:RNA polymerase sigma factor [Amycolatopsis sp. YIM 10]|uniref:RNA polymerase sigma factor n=1 Tax=Amycolatopsis sp. YIM 10 TaxID=2653857 RepID=UPI0012902A87|nr:RNA polymerase sigma factor [Amycolatopsis sp. YIM 10]QFU91130.1 ECF RNA polymerase sigma factor SigL [Amycolatopsis sp. YIM 10]